MFLSGSIAISPVTEVSDHAAAHQLRHFRNSLGNRAGDLEPKLFCYASERHAIVPGVFVFVYELDYGVRRVGTDHLHQLLLLEILVGGSYVEYVAAQLRRRSV